MNNQIKWWAVGKKEYIIMIEVGYKELKLILKIMDNDKTIGVVKRMDNSMFKAKITKNKDMYDTCIVIKSPDRDYTYSFSLYTASECIDIIRYILNTFRDN